MNRFFDLIKTLRKYFYDLLGGFQCLVIWIKKIPIAKFYISRKIKSEKTTCKKELNQREHFEKVIWKFKFCF